MKIIQVECCVLWWVWWNLPNTELWLLIGAPIVLICSLVKWWRFWDAKFALWEEHWCHFLNSFFVLHEDNTMYRKLSRTEKSTFAHPTLANFQTFQVAYMLSSAFLICTFCPQDCLRLHNFALIFPQKNPGGMPPDPLELWKAWRFAPAIHVKPFKKKIWSHAAVPVYYLILILYAVLIDMVYKSKAQQIYTTASRGRMAHHQ